MTLQTQINVDVDDLDKAIAFYVSALGLRVGRRLFENSVAELIGASCPIHLLAKPAGSAAFPGASEQRRYRRHWTPVHLDFVVADIQAAIRKATSAGAKLESDVETYDWGHIANLADPFGNGFCLIEFIGRSYDTLE